MCVGLVAVTAVVVTGDATPGRPDPYPLDSVLRLQDVQVLGTHNSYHERPDRPVLPLEPANYAYPPLNVQLAKQEHVRSLEIDVFNEPKIPVMHSIMVDEQSNCPRSPCACGRWTRGRRRTRAPARHDLHRDQSDPDHHQPEDQAGSPSSTSTDHSAGELDGAGLARHRGDRQSGASAGCC